MTIRSQLTLLEAVGIISISRQASVADYQFRHALLYDAAYGSLVRQDRRQIHAAVGEALESLFPERNAELAPILALHFSRAGIDEKAIQYYEQAGEHAGRNFAMPEALLNYSAAIGIAARHPAQTDRLYRRRGHIYETTGNYPCARQDYLHALRIARRLNDKTSEWIDLVALGKFWAISSYRLTGFYYHKALELARQSGDQNRIAHSLNYLANWNLNREEHAQAIQLHNQAMELFDALGDLRGMAETYDYLGMAYIMGSELTNGLSMYNHAIALFEQLGDELGIAASLAGMALIGPMYQVRSSDLPPPNLVGNELHALNALEAARKFAWRSSEVYCLVFLAEHLGFKGRYGEALEQIGEAHQIAIEIAHQQWEAAAFYVSGMIYQDLLFLPEARQALETAYNMSKSLHSLFWQRISAGPLILTYVQQGDFDCAASILHEANLPDQPAQSIGERSIWCARAELEIAQGNIASALNSLDHVPSSTLGDTLHVAYLKGIAFLEIGQTEKSARALERAAQICLTYGIPTMLWRIHAVRAGLMQSIHNPVERDQDIESAQQIFTRLADSLPDRVLRDRYLENAKSELVRLARFDH